MVYELLGFRQSITQDAKTLGTWLMETPALILCLPFVAMSVVPVTTRQ